MLKQLAYVKAPFAGQVYRRVFTLAGEVYATPREWVGRVVRFYAETGDGYLLFGETSSVSINTTQVSALAGTVLTGVATTAPKNLIDRSYIDVYVSPDDKFFTIKGSNDLVGWWVAHLADFGRSVI